VSEKKNYSWAIKYIKDLAFMVDESLVLGSKANMNYKVHLGFNPKTDLVSLQFVVQYKDQESGLDFMTGTVETGYLIKDLKQYEEKDSKTGEVKYDIADPLLIALFSMAYSHTRAVLATKAANTKYNFMLMPPIQPEAEFKKVFKDHLN